MGEERGRRAVGRAGAASECSIGSGGGEGLRNVREDRVFDLFQKDVANVGCLFRVGGV